MNHHTKTKGDLAVVKVIADLTEKGSNVALPISEHLPWDLLAELPNGLIKRVQVKHCSTKDGVMRIYLYNTYSDSNGKHKSGLKRNYIDIIAVYSPQPNKCYYINPDIVPPSDTFCLRVDSPISKQTKGINLADNFLSIV